VLKSFRLREGCETYLLWFLVVKHRGDFLFHQGESLSVIFGQAIFVNQLLRCLQIFFNAASVNSQSQRSTTVEAFAAERQTAKTLIA